MSPPLGFRDVRDTPVRWLIAGAGVMLVAWTRWAHGHGVGGRDRWHAGIGAQFPEWVHGRRHGAAGAYLFGYVMKGYYTPDGGWETDVAAPSRDAVLVDGAIRWYEHRP
jgi:hypothetical protein